MTASNDFMLQLWELPFELGADDRPSMVHAAPLRMTRTDLLEHFGPLPQHHRVLVEQRAEGGISISDIRPERRIAWQSRESHRTFWHVPTPDDRRHSVDCPQRYTNRYS